MDNLLGTNINSHVECIIKDILCLIKVPVCEVTKVDTIAVSAVFYKKTLGTRIAGNKGIEVT